MITLLIEHITQYATMYAFIVSGGCVIGTARLCKNTNKENKR